MSPATAGGHEMNCFDDPKPAFVSVQNETFFINGQSYQAIRCIIQKAQGVRKLFQDGNLKCYSMDATISQDRKTYCCFCEQKLICQRKIRLSMIMITSPQPMPVVLDINQPSFSGLQDIVERIGEEKLKNYTIDLKIIYDHHDRRLIEFSD